MLADPRGSFEGKPTGDAKFYLLGLLVCVE